MMQSLEEKQEYLRGEIIDKGYDPEEFTKFLSELANRDDLDLDEIPSDKIVTAVKMFQEKVNAANKTPSSDIPNEEDIAKENNANQGENNNQEKNENGGKDANNENGAKQSFDYIPPLTEDPSKIDTNKSIFADYCENVKAVEEKPKKFTDMEDMYIIVSSPQAVKKSFFSKTYFQYKLQIKGSDIQPVIRKLEDFEFLSRFFTDFYPGVFIPPVAPSHLSLKEDSVKKVNYLGRFINSIAENKLLRSSEIFTDFLTMEQEEFNNKRNAAYNKAPKPKNMNQFLTLSGNIQLYITEKKEEYAKNLKMEINKVNNIYKKLDNQLDYVMKQFDDVSKTLGEISKSFAELTKVYEDDEIMKSGMTWFTDFFNKWSDGYKEQKDFFMIDVKYYFKFVSKELDLIMPLYDTYKDIRDMYDDKFRTFTKLVQKTEKEEQKVVAAKRSYAYFLKQLIEEYDLLKHRHDRRLATEFVVLSENRDKFIKDCNCFKDLLNFSLKID